MTVASIPGVPAGRVTLKQGGVGKAMRALIERLFIRDFAALPFDGVGLGAMDDGAAIPICCCVTGSSRLPVTEDPRTDLRTS